MKGFFEGENHRELTFRITCPLDKGAVNEDIVAGAYTNALSTFDNNYEEIIKAIYLNNGSGEDRLTNMAVESIRRKIEHPDIMETGTKNKFS